MHEENKRKKFVNILFNQDEFEIIEKECGIYGKKAPYVTKILLEELSAFKKLNQFSITMTFDSVPIRKEDLTLAVQLRLDKDTYNYLYNLSKTTKISVYNLVRYFVIPKLPNKEVEQ